MSYSCVRLASKVRLCTAGLLLGCSDGGDASCGLALAVALCIAVISGIYATLQRGESTDVADWDMTPLGPCRQCMQPDVKGVAQGGSRGSSPDVLDAASVMRWSFPLFLKLVLFRIANALLVQTFFQPDEFFQSLEVAHERVFRYGWLTWEWQSENAIRSPLYPLLFVPGYWLVQKLGLEDTDALVRHRLRVGRRLRSET